MRELPQGWETCELKVCADVLDNLRVPVNSEERSKRLGNIPYFGATGQVGWINDFLFDEEILLIGEDGAPFFDKSKPIAYIVQGKSWVNNHAHVLRARPEITSNLFLKWFLDCFDFNAYVNGTTRLKLTQGSMNQIPVSLPPLNEQRRIVAKLEELLVKVDASQKRLARIPFIIKRFRQAVLAAACSGRLTADWREKNKDFVGAKQGSSASPAFGGDAGTGKAGEALALPLQNLGDDDLPDGWDTANVETVSQSLKYGTSQKCSHEKKGVPVLRIPNIADGIIDHNDLKYADLPTKEYEQLCLQHGDVLVIRSNGSVSLVGKSALVRDSENGFAYAGYLIRIRPNRAKIEPEYLNLVLDSYEVRLQIELPARSTSGVNNINSEELKALSFNLPPLPEQQEIVRRVESYFTLADQLETRYAKAKTHVDKLTQSILAKAFRGELVPQNPDDEPASLLLERIRNNRDTQPPEKKKKFLG